MLSLAFKFLVSMLIFNWICAEVNTVAPGATDYMDKVSEALAIPTHDQWGIDLSAFDGAASWFNKAEEDTGRIYRKHMSSLPSMTRGQSSSVSDSITAIKRFVSGGSRMKIPGAASQMLERF